MDLEAIVAKAVADARAAGATEAEAEAKGRDARAEAERVIAHPLYKSRDEEARKAFGERDKAKEKARSAVAQELDALKGNLSTLQQKLETVEPDAARAAKLTDMAKSLLEQELADVPKDLHALLPAGNPEDQLLWVRTAKAAGVLGKQKRPPVGGHMPGAGPVESTMPRAEYDRLSPAAQWEHIKKGGKVND